MTVIRVNPITGEKVVFAPGRSGRPTDLRKPGVPTNPTSAGVSNSNCPFCPGAEQETPPHTDEMPDGRGGWLTRTFPNKFAICKSPEQIVTTETGLFTEIHTTGIHEVIVEHPQHDMTFFKMNTEEMLNLLKTYGRRYRELMQAKELSYVLLFKNYGKDAGASLAHPHTQIIATPFIPSRVELEMAGFLKYQEKEGRCIFCDMIQEEITSSRKVLATEDFLVLAPFAAQFSYETWILPRKHQGYFTDMNESELTGLAQVMVNLFTAYGKVYGDFPFNLFIHCAPVPPHAGDFHWHIEIVPRRSKLAGFELGGGTMVNTVLPEDAAKYLLEGIEDNA